MSTCVHPSILINKQINKINTDQMHTFPKDPNAIQIYNTGVRQKSGFCLLVLPLDFTNTLEVCNIQHSVKINENYFSRTIKIGCKPGLDVNIIYYVNILIIGFFITL